MLLVIGPHFRQLAAALLPAAGGVQQGQEIPVQAKLAVAHPVPLPQAAHPVGLQGLADTGVQLPAGGHRAAEAHTTGLRGQAEGLQLAQQQGAAAPLVQGLGGGEQQQRAAPIDEHGVVKAALIHGDPAGGLPGGQRRPSRLVTEGGEGRRAPGQHPVVQPVGKGADLAFRKGLPQQVSQQLRLGGLAVLFFH